MVPAWTPLLVLTTIVVVLAPIPLLWVVEADRAKRWRWTLRRWMGRPSAKHVGVRSRRELLHLPSQLEAITVDAQRIRRGLAPLGLASDSQWAVWDWLRELQAFEERDPHGLQAIGVSSSTVGARLRAALEDTEPLRQIMRIDLELWTFIRAARRGGARGYR